MRILIDIGHPAHVHLFKNFTWEMVQKGHDVLFTVRDKEVVLQLLRYYNFDFVSFGKSFKNKTGKLFGLIKFNSQLLKVALKFKPDLFLSHGSIYAAHVSWLLRKPHIALEDSGNMEQILLYRPATEVILTPDVLRQTLGNPQIKYAGYHELTYLHPSYFKPDRSIRGCLGLANGEKFSIIRFVSWNATHDSGHNGISAELKKNLIQELEKHTRVFISSESELPDEFKKYQIAIPPERMHDALALADLCVGEGATMASEAGVLGTPAIYVNSIVRDYCEDQEEYGLVYNFRNATGVLEKVQELLSLFNLKQEWQKRRQKMLADKIDVTAFIVWFVENYPESVRIMKKNPDFQDRFRTPKVYLAEGEMAG